MNNKILNLLMIISTVISIISGILSLLSDFPKIYTVIAVLLVVILVFVRFKSNKYEFKIIDQQVILDITDEFGNLVHYICKKQLKCLQDNSNKYYYSFSAASHIKNFSLSGGQIENIKKENGRFIIEVDIGRPTKKDEILNLELSFDFIESFNQNSELWTMVRQDPGNGKYDLTIKFPQKRPFKSYRAYQSIGNYRQINPIQPKQLIIDSRPSLNFCIEKFKINEEYKLTWTW